MMKSAHMMIFLLAGLLSACGQSGRLYLPPDETPRVQAVTNDVNANVQPP